MESNFESRTMWTGDNLPILRGMNSECVDLIYLDPPFNSNRTYSAPIGSEAAGAAFKDTWTLEDVDDAWHGEIAEQNPAVYAVIGAAGEAHGKGMKSYLIMMAVRLLEIRRLLKPTGSIYLHCDPTTSHYLKLLMDAVFGVKNFRNEVIWHYKSFHGNVKRYFPKKHDVLFVYNKLGRWTFNRLFEEDNRETVDYRRWNSFLVDGRRILGKNMPGSGHEVFAFPEAMDQGEWTAARTERCCLRSYGASIGYRLGHQTCRSERQERARRLSHPKTH